jgi:hypothetical protein
MIQVFIGGSPVDFECVSFYCEPGLPSGNLRYEIHAWDPRVTELLFGKLPFGEALTLTFEEASLVFEVFRGAKDAHAARGAAAYTARTIEEFCMSRDRVYVRGFASLGVS